MPQTRAICKPPPPGLCPLSIITRSKEATHRIVTGAYGG